MNEHYPELIPGNFYHIFNRAINRDKIFPATRNYSYFLKKYDNFVSDLVDTYAYCLLPNHFHLLVKVKEHCNAQKIPSFKKMESSQDPGEQFRRFFISYAMSINKQELRRGSLFIKNFKRKIITNPNDLQKAIYYIHYNPVYHRLRKRIEDYYRSSYLSLLSDKPTKLAREKVFELFGNRNNFIEFHNQKYKEYDFWKIEIE